MYLMNYFWFFNFLIKKEFNKKNYTKFPFLITTDFIGFAILRIGELILNFLIPLCNVKSLSFKEVQNKSQSLFSESILK